MNKLGWVIGFIGFVAFQLFFQLYLKKDDKPKLSWQQISFPTTIDCGVASQFDGKISLYVRISDNYVTGLWGIMAEKGDASLSGERTNVALHSGGLICSRVEQTEVSEEYQKEIQSSLEKKVGRSN